MMIKPTMYGAVALVLAGSALAAGPATSSETTGAANQSSSQIQTSGGGVDPAIANQQARRLGVQQLSDLEDKELVDAQGKVIGEVDRLGTDSANGDILLVIGLEGVTEENMKEVTVPIEDVSTIGEDRLQTSLSKDQLQQKRDVDPWDGSYTQNVPR